MANKKPAKTKPKTGRPKGSGNKDRVIVRVVRAACPKCGGTNGRVERKVREADLAGVLQTGEHAGFAYSHVVWRDAVCLDCGQHRREVHYEQREGEAAA